MAKKRSRKVKFDTSFNFGANVAKKPKAGKSVGKGKGKGGASGS